GAIQATTTTVSRDGASMVDWLNASFGHNGSRPEALYLIGSRAKLEALAIPLQAALHVPVIADHDAQLALARGAAFSDGRHVEAVVAKDRSALISAARTFGVVAAVAAATVFTLSAASAP